MSAFIVARETPTGWDIKVDDAKFVHVTTTDGKTVTIIAIPDDGEPASQPLDVTLGDPA